MAALSLTGIILAALLDPDSARACSCPAAVGLFAVQRAYLVAGVRRHGSHELVVIEHKRFALHSHCPRTQRKDPEAPWHTDRLYDEASSGF